jgi:hypothetical protein
LLIQPFAHVLLTFIHQQANDLKHEEKEAVTLRPESYQENAAKEARLEGIAIDR